MGVTRAERRGFEAAAFAGSGRIGGNRRHRRPETRSSRFAATLGPAIALTPTSHLMSAAEDHQAFIGGSDACTITGEDEAALLRLWREKRGDVRTSGD